MEKLKISDLLDYKFLSGIVASPSGKKAAFLAKQANKEKNSYDSWAYIADFCTGEVRKPDPPLARNPIFYLTARIRFCSPQ